MPRNKSRKKAAERRKNTSTLKEHKQKGKLLSPPLLTVPRMELVPWLRDSFPDLIWLNMVLESHGAAGMLIASRFLDRIDDVLARTWTLDDRPSNFVMTGQLTMFERVPDESRTAVLEALKADGLFDRAIPGYSLGTCSSTTRTCPAAGFLRAGLAMSSLFPRTSRDACSLGSSRRTTTDKARLLPTSRRWYCALGSRQAEFGSLGGR